MEARHSFRNDMLSCPRTPYTVFAQVGCCVATCFEVSERSDPRDGWKWQCGLWRDASRKCDAGEHLLKGDAMRHVPCQAML